MWSDAIPRERETTNNNMRTTVIVLLACGMSPAWADVYRCTSDGRTTYQDVPCANATLIENINGLPPSRSEQMKAVERANRERHLTAELGRGRETNERSVTITQAAVRSRPAPRPNGPDSYYDRPDRFNHRTVAGTPYIQRKQDVSVTSPRLQRS